MKRRHEIKLKVAESPITGAIWIAKKYIFVNENVNINGPVLLQITLIAHKNVWLRIARKEMDALQLEKLIITVCIISLFLT